MPAAAPVTKEEKNFSLLRSETKTVVKEFGYESDAKKFQDQVDPYGMFTEVQKNR